MIMNNNNSPYSCIYSEQTRGSPVCEPQQLVVHSVTSCPWCIHSHYDSHTHTHTQIVLALHPSESIYFICCGYHRYCNLSLCHLSLSILSEVWNLEACWSPAASQGPSATLTCGEPDASTVKLWLQEESVQRVSKQTLNRLSSDAVKTLWFVFPPHQLGETSAMSNEGQSALQKPPSW